MSVRAYKIKKIDHNNEPTFNLWHNEEIWDLLDLANSSGLNDDGCGIITIMKSEAEEAVANVKNPQSFAVLQKIIEDCGDKDYVEYYCY